VSFESATRGPALKSVRQRRSSGSSPQTQPLASVSPDLAFVGGFQQLINGLPEQIALVDEHWTILAVNSAWIKTAALYDYSALQPGTNYLDFCRARSAEGHAPAGLVVAGIDRMVAEGDDSYRFIYHGKDRWEGHSFQLCVNRFEMSGRQLATVTRYDVTELVKLRHLRESQSHDLLEGQASERRRIAREMHDSTMQLLVSLGLAIGRLKRGPGLEQNRETIAEMEQLLSETQQEIRSISYLAHPPLLKEIGLASALRLLADGFGQRTGLKISLRIEGNPKMAWQAAEVAMYRVVQEALSNVHRHAKATEIAVGLFVRRSIVHVAVSDNGTGISDFAAKGVGLAGMQERLASLGGRFSIRREKPGTVIIASLPVQPVIRAIGDLAMRD
jgi:two-component system, NarL family, sensor kinase